MEQWLEINNHPDYEVSNLGRIRSKDREVSRGTGMMKKQGVILSLNTNGNGLLTFQSHQDGERTTLCVHKCVAEAFVDKPSEEHCYVIHEDGDYENNRANNLRWVTSKEKPGTFK